MPRFRAFNSDTGPAAIVISIVLAWVMAGALLGFDPGRALFDLLVGGFIVAIAIVFLLFSIAWLIRLLR